MKKKLKIRWTIHQALVLLGCLSLFATLTFTQAIVRAQSGGAAQSGTPKPAAASPGNEDPTKRYLNEGYGHLRQHNLAQAIVSFKKAAAAGPSNLTAHLELAYTLIRNDATVEAIKTMERVIVLAPTSAPARSQLGYLYLKENRSEEAVKAFLEVERLTPANEEIKLQLAYLYDKAGNKPEARQRFAQLIEADNLEISLKAEQALKNLAPPPPAQKGLEQRF